MNDVDLNELKIQHEPLAGKKRFSFVPAAVLFVFGLVLGFLAARTCHQPDQETASPLNPVAPAPIESEKTGPSRDTGFKESFTEGGWIEVPSYHPVVVTALVPGRLDELNVLEGSRVKKGDVIARLYQKDRKDALDRALAELKVAEANRARLKAGFRIQEIEKARSEMEAALADLELKEKIVARTRDLLSSGAVSREDLDRDEAQSRAALSLYESRRQELLLKEEGSRTEDIQAAEAQQSRARALVELARNQYEYSTITSPADGVVLERFVTPGTWIPADNPRIVSLFDPEDLQVRVDVRQEHIKDVFIGQDVEVFTDAEANRAYKGTVIRIEPLADFKKNTVQIKVRLLETSSSLFPEMIARIRFKRKDDAKDNRQD